MHALILAIALSVAPHDACVGGSCGVIRQAAPVQRIVAAKPVRRLVSAQPLRRILHWRPLRRGCR